MNSTTLNRLYDETVMAMFTKMTKQERQEAIKTEAERPIFACLGHYTV